MAKSLWHSELVSLGPVKVEVVSDVLESKKKRGSFYVTLKINGEERYYNIENDQCDKFFAGRRGQVISICAEGSREDAIITLVGEEVGARQQARQPETRQAPAQPASRPAPADAGHPAPAGAMRAGEIRYERTVGLPNYSSEKIGITVFLEEGAKAAEALAFAKKFVEAHLQAPSGDRRH